MWKSQDGESVTLLVKWDKDNVEGQVGKGE